MSNSNSKKNNNYDENWLHKKRFPKSAKYDLQWMLANEMGPNALWLLEDLTKHMALPKESRVLDMGCGRAMTSIFLAQEFQSRVWANDLWVDPDDNWSRITSAGQENRICPIRAEAHNLPYAAAFFDAIVSIDAYQYFGTDVGYLGYISRFLKTGGRLGLVMPALMQEIDLEPPPHFMKTQESGAVFWDHHECWTIRTLQWWIRHFTRSALFDIEVAVNLEDGWKLWRDWERIRDGGGLTNFPSQLEVIEEDAGQFIGFVMLVLKQRPRKSEPFDHSLRIRL